MARQTGIKDPQRAALYLRVLGGDLGRAVHIPAAEAVAVDRK